MRRNGDKGLTVKNLVMHLTALAMHEENVQAFTMLF